jgi:hypothetical protein
MEQLRFDQALFSEKFFWFFFLPMEQLRFDQPLFSEKFFWFFLPMEQLRFEWFEKKDQHNGRNKVVTLSVKWELISTRG